MWNSPGKHLKKGIRNPNLFQSPMEAMRKIQQGPKDSNKKEKKEKLQEKLLFKKCTVVQ